MKHHSALAGIVIACAVLGGCRTPVAPPAPAPPAVVVASPLVLRLSEWDEYTGRFEATDRVDVRARVDGYLDSIHFRDGATVKPGDLLFVIDPRPYEAVLEGARADVVRAQTRVELATTDFTRGEQLFAIRGISQEEFDRRVQARKEADAALIVARATERAAGLNVEFTRVRAPIGGRISQKFVSVGNLISGGQAGSTLLTTIVAVDPIQFFFDASESDYLKYNRMNLSGRTEDLTGGPQSRAHSPARRADVHACRQDGLRGQSRGSGDWHHPWTRTRSQPGRVHHSGAVRTPPTPWLGRVRRTARARQRDPERSVTPVRVGVGEGRPAGATRRRARQSRARPARRARGPGARRSDCDQRHAAGAARREGHSRRTGRSNLWPAVEDRPCDSPGCLSTGRFSPA